MVYLSGKGQADRRCDAIMFPRLLPAKRTVTSPANEDIIMTIIIIGSFCTVETLNIKINSS